MIEQVDRLGKSWKLVYTGRHREHMAFAGQLVEQYGSDKVTVHPSDELGRLDLDAVLATPRAYTAVYACGPESMLRTVEELCMGWPPGCLHTERFDVTSIGPGSTAMPFTVELARSGHVVDVPADMSILESIERAGVRVLSSCRSGLCGTCEIGVLGGEPDHRDSVLTDQDRRTTR